MMRVEYFSVLQSSLSESTLSEEQCMEGWRFYNNKCYSLFEENLAFEDAMEFCKHQRADILTISSLEDVEEIYNVWFDKLSSDEAVWLGYVPKEHSDENNLNEMIDGTQRLVSQNRSYKGKVKNIFINIICINLRVNFCNNFLSLAKRLLSKL